jgi:hypothetical protein
MPRSKREVGMSRRGAMAASVGLGLMLTACPPVHEVGDAGTAGDGGPADAAQPSALEQCLGELTLDQPFALDPGGPTTQIHVDVAFDGRGLWIAYNLPDLAGGFDVFLARLACDGTPLVPAFRANTTTAGNDVDPSLALDGDRLALVWTSDNGTGVDNMDTYVRTFHADGTPRMSADRTLETTRLGTPVTGNVMDPRLVLLPVSGMAIAAERGLDETGTFQVFVQRLDDDGNLQGEAIDVVIESAVTQSMPGLAATANGDLYLSYSRATASGEQQILQTRIPAGSSTPDPLPPRLVVSWNADLYSAMSSTADGLGAYLTYGIDANVVVMDGDSLTAGAPFATFGQGGGLDFGSRVVAAPGGGVVFWYRNISGFRNELYAAAFADDGAALTPSPTVLITPGPVPPYGVAATHVDGELYFVAWSAGTSPDFRLQGMFTRIE